MRTTTAAAVILATVLLAGCSSSGTGASQTDAASEAASVCRDMGVRPNEDTTPSADASSTPDFAGLIDHANGYANRAAAAAVKDARWNRLADALSELVDWLRASDRAQAQSQPLPAEDTANVKDALATLNAECRKAYAAAGQAPDTQKVRDALTKRDAA